MHVADGFMKWYLPLRDAIAFVGKIVGLVVEGELYVDGALN